MNQDKFITTLQKFFGATKNEIIFGAVIILGLLIGIIIKMTGPDSMNAVTPAQEAQLTAVFDSIANSRKTTFVGTDINNNIFEELSKGDTIVAKEEPLTKQLPKGKIDLNSASRVQLMTLPGIGEKTAMLIIQYRQLKPLTKPEDIMRIKGIGQKKFEKLKDYIEVK